MVKIRQQTPPGSDVKLEENTRKELPEQKKAPILLCLL